MPRIAWRRPRRARHTVRGATAPCAEPTSMRAPSRSRDRTDPAARSNAVHEAAARARCTTRGHDGLRRAPPTVDATLRMLLLELKLEYSLPTSSAETEAVHGPERHRRRRPQTWATHSTRARRCARTSTPSSSRKAPCSTSRRLREGLALLALTTYPAKEPKTGAESLRNGSQRWP